MRQDRYSLLLSLIDEGRWEIDINAGTVIGTRGGTGVKNSNGYMMTTTRKDGKQHMFLHHQVIAVAGGLNPVGMTINHKDGNRLNNSISNLEVITMEANNEHAKATGLLSKRKVNEDNVRKLTADKAREIKRLLAEGTLSQYKIAKLFDVSRPTISDIKHGRAWAGVSA